MKTKSENILLNTINTIIWASLCVFIGLIVYHHFYSRQYVIGTVDLDHILAVKMSDITIEGQKNNLTDSQLIAKSAEFAKELVKVSNQVANEHHVVLLPKKAVVYNQDVDFTKEIQKRLGVDDAKPNIYSSLSQTIENKGNN